MTVAIYENERLAAQYDGDCAIVTVGSKVGRRFNIRHAGIGMATGRQLLRMAAHAAVNDVLGFNEDIPDEDVLELLIGQIREIGEEVMERRKESGYGIYSNV